MLLSMMYKQLLSGYEWRRRKRGEGKAKNTEREAGRPQRDNIYVLINANLELITPGHEKPLPAKLSNWGHPKAVATKHSEINYQSSIPKGGHV
jgi:hypothetical protein